MALRRSRALLRRDRSTQKSAKEVDAKSPHYWRQRMEYETVMGDFDLQLAGGGEALPPPAGGGKALAPGPAREAAAQAAGLVGRATKSYPVEPRAAGSPSWHDDWRGRVQRAQQDEARAFRGIQPVRKRSKTSQAIADWTEQQQRMPLGETSISSRKHSVVRHLMNIRGNPKYRWNHERFVSRRTAAISDLAHRGVPPELLLLEAGAPLPRHIRADKTNIVYCDRWVLSTAAGLRDSEGVVAEYFIPEEEPKNQLWLDGGPALHRVAVLLGVHDAAHLGALLRSAVGLGFDAVLLAEGCADPYDDAALDASLCAHVTAGGYPRLHVLREEDGDDVWGIVNRVLARHQLLAVAAAACDERQGGEGPWSLGTDAVWRRLQDDGALNRGMCVFFGDELGVDVDYVRHNIDAELVPVALPTVAGAPALDAAAQAAVVMDALREPTFSHPVPALVPAATAAAPAPPRAMRVSKSYLRPRGSASPTTRPAYKTEIDVDFAAEAAAFRASAAAA